MRPGQNKRMRGRPTNNRRGPNPLTRSYESNGPDVKIRGNAHHVAEKYLQLARDAHTGGDPVAAENYLQHAEHYFRLIAAAQAAQALAQSGQQRPPGEADDDLDDDSDFGALSDRFASPAERQTYQQSQPGFQPQPSLPPNAPQPFGDRPAYEAERQGGGDRGGFAPRQDRQGNRFPDRGPRPDRPFAERNDGNRDNRHGRDGRPREFRPYRDSQPQPTREADADTAPAALPSFITASPRPNSTEPVAGAPTPEAEVSPTPMATPEAGPSGLESPSEGNAAFQPRGRRRRLRSPYGFGGANSGEAEQPDATPETADDSPVRE